MKTQLSILLIACLFIVNLSVNESSTVWAFKNATGSDNISNTTTTGGGGGAGSDVVAGNVSKTTSRLVKFNKDKSQTTMTITAAALKDDKNRTEDKTNLNNFEQRKWVSQLFAEGENLFDIAPGVSQQCKRDYDLYKLHLRNQSVWAVRMMESSQWPASGIFAGTLDHLGNFEECLAVSSRGIKGQYCVARAKYTLHDSLINRTTLIKAEKAEDESSVWNAIEMYLENPVRLDRRKVNWALCIPKSCTNNDLELSLNNTLYPLFKNHSIDIDIDIEPRLCKTIEPENYPPGYYYVSALFGILFSLMIGASIYDASTKEDTKKGMKEPLLIEVFKSFSAPKNFKKLISYSPNSDFVMIHFAKILNIILVIYGHRFIYYIGYPRFNSDVIESFYKASSLELIHTNVVDVFFAISGILTFHFGFLPMKKGGALYLIFSIIFRWIRMVPVFGLLMLFIVYILPYVNDGPMWDYRIMKEVENCQATWWANLLVINNYVKTDQQCLVISWYISTDIQLTIIGSILLLVATRNIKWGVISSIGVFLLSTVITFVVGYKNKYYGLLRLYMSLLEDPRQSTEFNHFYIAAFSRAGPYMMGFFSAMLAKILKENGITLSGRQTFFYAALSILVGEGSQYYGCVFYAFGREYNRVESALYAALNRSVFVLPYCVLFVLYLISSLGFLQKLLERRIFVPFGRLTYCAFLVNTIIQLIHASSQRTTMPSANRMNLYWWAFSDIGTSYLAGLFLHLLCEAPIVNMSKLLQRSLFGLVVKKKDINVKDKNINSLSPEDVNEKSESKNKLPDLTNGKIYHNGYHNQSFVNTEIVSKVTESSKV